MYKLIGITDRHLCKGDFLQQLERMVRGGVHQIILREKDLSEEAYRSLAIDAIRICRDSSTELILHRHVEAAKKLAYDRIHLPLDIAAEADCGVFQKTGSSIHSLEELRMAEELFSGVPECYYTVSHIFKTNCKPNLPPKGLLLLSDIRKSTSVPLYALGGVTPKTIPLLKPFMKNDIIQGLSLIHI